MSERIGRVLRPDSAAAPGFSLAYVRSGPRTRTPTVVVPGGPGLGSIMPYRRLRRTAAKAGLDLIMVEHRGIGFSRRDRNGHLLTHDAMWITEVIDDIAAVLDHEHIESAFIFGSSYGSYLASAFGVRHPARVAGMILDSALQSVSDLSIERALLRERLWQPESVLAGPMRALLDRDISERKLLDVARAAIELGGVPLALRMLELRRAHLWSPTWRLFELYAGRDESIVNLPGHYEFDIAGAIGFRELDYGAAPDGLPLDPAITYSELSDRFPAFAGEPYDLPSLTPGFDWPLIALAGHRDLRTPPEIAERTVRTARDGVLVEIENGHSALDTHPAIALNAVRALVEGWYERLPALAPKLDRLPRRGLSAHLPEILGAAARIEKLIAGPRG